MNCLLLTRLRERIQETHKIIEENILAGYRWAQNQLGSLGPWAQRHLDDAMPRRGIGYDRDPEK